LCFCYLSDDAEKVLASQVAKFATELAPLYADGNYQEALSQLAGIRFSVDNFFDNVMVMADDEAQMGLYHLLALDQYRKYPPAYQTYQQWRQHS
jgi:glycyl-tRNA synthetase beta subunit